MNAQIIKDIETANLDDNAKLALLYFANPNFREALENHVFNTNN